MDWPTMSDYQETIQNPNTCFSDPELKNGTPILNNLGLPKPIAGGFACVYQMLCGSHNYAVRCFLTKQIDLEKRYRIISDYLRQINLSYMVSFDFLSHGIKVNEKWFPILKMEWINGEPLNIYLEKNLHEPQKLEALASNFATLIKNLHKYSIAHGDLQHENILVANEQLKLIDYDGLYVPGLEAIPSNEYGHRNYQHPSRSEKDYGPNLDTFSAWVIYTSILALCRDPNLWNQLESGDGYLIFRKEDFLDPNQSFAFKLFEQSPIAPIQSYAKQLKFLLNINDLSKIPLPDTSPFSAYKNLHSISHQGLPAWLQDNEMLQKIISDKSTATRSKSSSRILNFIEVYVSKCKCLRIESLSFGLSSIVGSSFMKKPNDKTQYINNELRKYTLKDSRVPGIGAQLIKSLNNAGITTAADILNIHIVQNNRHSPKAVVLIEVPGKGKIRIEGIGPVKARALQEWKELLESELNKPKLLQTSQLGSIKATCEKLGNLMQKIIKQLMLKLAKALH